MVLSKILTFGFGFGFGIRPEAEVDYFQVFGLQLWPNVKIHLRSFPVKTIISFQYSKRERLGYVRLVRVRLGLFETL